MTIATNVAETSKPTRAAGGAETTRVARRVDGGPIDAALAALESKDLDRLLAHLTDDATIIDPHYPVERMVGKEAIADGMRWLFGAMVTLRFDVTDAFASTDGRRVMVELVARHVAPGDRSLEIPQVFVIDIDAGRVAGLRAYQPYGPGGPIGVFLKLTRLARRLRRSRAAGSSSEGP